MEKNGEQPRQKVSSGTAWEREVGYSRAIRVGNRVYVAGTTAVDEEGRLVGENNPYAQAMFIFRKIESALTEAGASMSDVVRTRMYIIRREDWEAVGRAHGAFFRETQPAATLIVVQGLIAPELLIEIEVDAEISDHS